MAIINVPIIIDLRAVKAFIEDLEATEKGSSSSMSSRGLGQAADILQKYLKRRFYAGGGKPRWPKLSESTQKRKKQRGFNPNHILREKDELIDAIGKKRIKGSWTVGYVGAKANKGHWRFDGTIAQLAEIHQSGDYPRSPGPRVIIVEPTPAVRKRMVRAVIDSLNKSVSKSNAKLKRQ